MYLRRRFLWKPLWNWFENYYCLEATNNLSLAYTVCFFIDINECSSEPCLNGGTCEDRTNRRVMSIYAQVITTQFEYFLVDWKSWNYNTVLIFTSWSLRPLTFLENGFEHCVNVWWFFYSVKIWLRLRRWLRRSQLRNRIGRMRQRPLHERRQMCRLLERISMHLQWRIPGN